jgi:hypothetical protein
VRPTTAGIALVLVLLAGCSGTGPPTPTPAAPPPLGTCDITLPDGSRADCQQHAQRLGATASRIGFLCSEQTVPGPQGQVQLLRKPASGETAIGLALSGPSSGIAWLGSDPDRMWSWTDAQGDEAWSLGPIAAGQSLFIKAYTFSLQDANDTAARPSIEQLWTPMGGQAYAIHRIVVAGEELFLDRMVGLDLGSGVQYSLASFDQYDGPHLLQGRHAPLVSTRLATHDLPSC